MRSPALRVIPPAARLTDRPNHRVVVGLHGNNFLLNLRQQLLGIDQRQTQMAISPRPSGRQIAITSTLRD